MFHPLRSLPLALAAAFAVGSAHAEVAHKADDVNPWAWWMLGVASHEPDSAADRIAPV